MRVFTPVCAVLVCLICVSSALAQSESERGMEVFGGFTRSRSELACCLGNGNGYHLGVGYTPARFLVLQSEFSHAGGSNPQYVRHLHFGPQVRIPFSSFRPFGRVMVGFSEHRTKCPDLPDILTTRGFSVALGGGLDLFVHRRAAFRVISFDRIRTEENWDTRASFGVVFVLF